MSLTSTLAVTALLFLRIPPTTGSVDQQAMGLSVRQFHLLH